MEVAGATRPVESCHRSCAGHRAPVDDAGDFMRRAYGDPVRESARTSIGECLAAGIEEFVFVTGRNKSALEDHFDAAYELEATLKARNKTKELAILAEQRIETDIDAFFEKWVGSYGQAAVWAADRARNAGGAA